MPIERTCVYCGELFTVRYPGSKKRFCGRACSNTQKNKAMEWTHERKSKISKNISKGDKYVTCCLGADPGSKGAMFAIYSTGDIEHIDFKNASDLDIYHFVSLVSLACDELIVGMENVHSQPDDGVKQAFTFGGQVYRIKTILNLAGIEYTLIQPQKWMNYMGWGRIPHGKENYDKRKKVLLEIAKEITDYKHLTLENADAFLIATYIGKRLKV